MQVYTWGSIKLGETGEELASFSPDDLVVIAYLELTVHGGEYHIYQTRDPSVSPTGSFPLLVDKGKRITGAKEILRYLESQKGGSSLDSHLSYSQRATSQMLVSYLDLQLSILTYYNMCINETNFESCFRPLLASQLPFPNHYIVPSQFRKCIENYLHACGVGYLMDQTLNKDFGYQSERVKTGLRALHNKQQTISQKYSRYAAAAVWGQPAQATLLDCDADRRKSILDYMSDAKGDNVNISGPSMRVLMMADQVYQTVFAQIKQNGGEYLLGQSISTADLFLLAHLKIQTAKGLYPDEFLTNYVSRRVNENPGILHTALGQFDQALDHSKSNSRYKPLAPQDIPSGAHCLSAFVSQKAGLQ